MNLLRRPQLLRTPQDSLGPPFRLLGGLSAGFKPSTCCCLGTSGPGTDSSWSSFRFRSPGRAVCVRRTELGSVQRSSSRTGLNTLETPSAASAQEIPQLPGAHRSVHRGALFPAQLHRSRKFTVSPVSVCNRCFQHRCLLQAVQDESFFRITPDFCHKTTIEEAPAEPSS